MRTLLPPALPALPRPLAGGVRALWLGALVVAVAAQLGGLAFTLGNAYRTQPAFFDYGLTSAIEADGTVVSPVGRESLAQRVAEESRVVAIDGQALPPHATAEAIAARLRAAPAGVTVRLRDPHGRVSDHRLTRSPAHRTEALHHNPIPLAVRMTLRLVFAALGTLALIGSAVLLYRRRPDDPEAVLISFAFLLMATVVDPPLLMWMGLGLAEVVDGVTGLWWTMIVIALAAFPTGRFAPGWLRWTMVAAPPLGLVLALDLESELVSLAIGVLPPLAILVAQVHRYRGLAPGIERQQIKWAAFGFAAGFVVLGLSLGLAELADDHGWSPLARSAFTVAVVCMFSAAFALMPLGLLVSLLRFRLWEADAVIRRSANVAALTLIVGFVFTLAADVTKALVAAVFGSGHAVVATALGAMLAVAVFTPAKTLVLRWSKQRFDSPLQRLHELPDELAVWRRTEDADELGTRVLATIVEAVHAEFAALFVLTPTGRELVACTNVDDQAALQSLRAGRSDALPWAEALSLRDDHGPAGTLMLGPRSDRNRFNRREREALHDVATPIAEALRIARGRMRTDLLRELEARLARLEASGTPKPA